MSSGSTVGSTKVISPEEWNRRLSMISLNKKTVNKLIMNYLVIEGFKQAAEHFEKESGTEIELDSSTIGQRMAIRSAIQNGQIEEAIEQVNDLDPDILDRNSRLIFELKLQQLIELIKSSQIEQALEFAQDEMAARGEENSELLEELEQTMALLAFENPSASPMKHLFEHSHRNKAASHLNAAILESQNQDRDPRLPRLLKILLWSQKNLAPKCQFPETTDFDLPTSPSS